MKTTEHGQMKTKAVASRTRWQGWTIVEKNGSLVLDIGFDEPMVWKRKENAVEVKEEWQKVVRCEVRVIQ